MKKFWKWSLVALLALFVVAALTLVACDTNDNRNVTNRHKVTFKADGSVVSVVEFDEGDETLNEPSVPEKPHYTGKWADYSLGEQDIVVNAIYTPIEYTITFDDGTKQTQFTYTIEDQTGVVLPTVTPKDHYTGGWQQYQLQYTNEQVVHAEYKPIEYKITFVGEGQRIEKFYTEATANQIVAPTVPAKQYYTGQWQQFAPQFDDSQVVEAVYTPIEYRITFVGNGQREERTYTVETKDNVTAPQVPAKEKYFGFDYVGTWEDFDFEFDDNQEVNAVYTLDTPGYTYTLNEDQQSYSLTTVSTDIEEAIVLPFYNELPVTSIGERAFCNCINLQTITFVGESKLQSIGDYCFEYCFDLTSITLPNTVRSIGIYAFSNCNHLQTLTFGSDSKLQSIGASAFYGCGQLISIVIPSMVTNFGNSSFYGCTNLQTVTFEDGSQLQSIGSEAFSGCSSLISITIPSTVTSIAHNAFSDCSQLSTVYWNATKCEEVGDSENSIFNYCSVLTNVVIGENILSLPSYAFSSCSNLKNVCYSGTIENWCGVKFDSIYANPLYYAEKFYMKQSGEWQEVLGKIEIPKGVEKIGDFQFYKFNITSVTIPSTVTSIGDSAFYSCRNLQSVTFEGGSQLQNIEAAFSGCDRLESMTLPFVGENADGSGATHFGYIFGANDYKENQLSVPTSLTQLVIMGGASISDYAFYACGQLISITIPSTVASVGKRAFEDCGSLQTVMFDGDSQLKSIENHAFQSCSRLESIIIPNSVISIGKYAFNGCEGLEDITLPFVGQNADGTGALHFGYIFGASSYDDNYSYVPTSLATVVVTGSTNIGYEAFRNCRHMASITIPSTVTSIDGDAFRDCTGLRTVTFENEGQLQYIGPFAFYGCNQLTSINLPNTVKSIESNAFFDCSQLTSIVIPSAVTSIGDEAFRSCDNLQMVTFESESQLKSIGRSSFFSCQLTKIIIPNTVTSIGDEAFYNCNNLQTVTFESGSKLKLIGNMAFYGCSQLIAIIIPNTVTSIGEDAFNVCNKLTIYSEAAGEPLGWHPRWNPDNRPVVWNSCGLALMNGIVYALYHDNIASVSNTTNELLTQVVILQSVEFNEERYIVSNIESHAFDNCYDLTSITIPSTVTSIGGSAFENCTNLRTVTLDGDSQLQSIGEYAFV